MAQHISKNREANELYARARAKAATLADTTKEFTLDEVEAIDKEVKALNLRAQLLAEQTPDAEIARQGGDEALTRVASVEESDAVPPSLKDQVAQFRTQAISAFGGIANFVRAAGGVTKALSGKQQALLARAGELTRTIIGTTSDASGGEFLLPLEQEQSIFQVDNTIPGLLQRARMYSMRGRTKRIPYVVQTNEELTRPLSGISAISIVGEGQEKPAREPVFAQRVLTAYKYAAISKFSDEMLDDDMTGDIDGTVVRLVGQEILNQINYDVTIAGSGSSQPTGALHTSANGALLKVTRQSQNLIKFADAVNMYTAHTHGPNSFWMVSRSGLAQLLQFELSAGSTLAFLASMAVDPSNARLLGYPIVVTDFLNVLGTEGDFALVNPDHYAAALRKQLTVESSIHVEFVNDITTWRFFARGGGINIPTAPYAYRSASSTNVAEHSPFVVLDDVYV
jgi:HK97 family phage major capsid protein